MLQYYIVDFKIVAVLTWEFQMYRLNTNWFIHVEGIMLHNFRQNNVLI